MKDGQYKERRIVCSQQVIQIAKAWEYLIQLVKSDQFTVNKQTAFDLNKLVAAADYAEVGYFNNETYR
ncbi:MAG: hypothetical protein GY860_19875 [Desulfobacteraceae bacterium]|nr:hypothetical protein [Desulfobacteraceae bacterium]